MAQKVLVVLSRNESPTQKIDEELKRLGNRWRVVQATTIMVPHGTIDFNMAIEELMVIPAVQNSRFVLSCKD